MKVIFCVIWHKLTKWSGTTYNKITNNVFELNDGRKEGERQGQREVILRGRFKVREPNKCSS